MEPKALWDYLEVPAWHANHEWLRPYDEITARVKTARDASIKNDSGIDPSTWDEIQQRAFVRAHNNAWRDEIMLARGAGVKRRIGDLYATVIIEDLRAMAPSQQDPIRLVRGIKKNYIGGTADANAQQYRVLQQYRVNSNFRRSGRRHAA
jgi:hypothetical protein